MKIGVICGDPGLFRCSSYHQVGPHDFVAAFPFIVSLQFFYQQLDGTFAYLLAVLLYRGQFRVCALGNGSVCEPADGHFVRHFPSHQFAGIEDARCCFVVDGKETVRTVGAFQQVSLQWECFPR